MVLLADYVIIILIIINILLIICNKNSILKKYKFIRLINNFILIVKNIINKKYQVIHQIKVHNNLINIFIVLK